MYLSNPYVILQAMSHSGNHIYNTCIFVPDPCVIDGDWLDIYNIEVKPEPELPNGDILQANITHGSILKLTCISDLEREKSLECQYGNWTDQPQLCPEIGKSTIDVFTENKHIRDSSNENNLYDLELKRCILKCHFLDV